MNLSAVRDEFVDALTGIDGIYPTTDVPSTMDAGACWPMLTGLEATGAPGCFTAGWLIRVVTGGDQQDGTAFMDEHLSGVINALAPVAFVQSVTPVILATSSAGDLYGIDIRVVRE